MREVAVLAVLHFFCAAEFEITSAFIAQRIQGTVAEQAVKLIAFRRLVAGEILALTIAEKPVAVLHGYILSTIS